MPANRIEIYTDGSCHTQLLKGAWAAVILVNKTKTIIKGSETGTTHNRMELLAVIKAIEWVSAAGLVGDTITVFSDSQYVVNLLSRKEKLEAKKFMTNKGTPIQNNDLVQNLLHKIATHTLAFTKVKAHQKPNGVLNFNREVDHIVRKLVRENVTKND